MIEVTSFKMQEDDLNMIGGLDFSSFAKHSTLIDIGNVNALGSDRIVKPYIFTMELVKCQNSWESDIKGFWQDYLFHCIDSMAGNIHRDNIKLVRMNISFTIGGIAYIFCVTFEEFNAKKQLRKLKKQNELNELESPNEE